MSSSSWIERRVGSVVQDRLRDEPVITLQGARSVGKSVLLARLAREAGATVIDLDDPATRSAVSLDPSVFVSGPGLVCIDEYQHVPRLLDAIKAELNRDLRPGRFLLTGSTRYEALPRASQSLAGRLHLLTVRPLSQSELAGTNVDLIPRLLSGNAPSGRDVSGTSRDDYAERIAAGGMPIQLNRSGAARSRWFADYIGAALQRNALDLANIRQPEALAGLFRALSAQTGQLLNISQAAAKQGLTERTANNYIHLLENLFLIHRLPGWAPGARSRANKVAKVYMLDSGLCMHALGLTPAKLAAPTPSALTDFGHLLESFVVSELLTQASWLDEIANIGYWRTAEGDEVDLVLETTGGILLACEIKASSQVRPGDLRGLRRLRDKMTGVEIDAVAFYLGPHAYRTPDGISVVPVDSLWRA